MKPTVQTLIEELTGLKGEERALEDSLVANRQRQAEIIGSLQVKPPDTPAPAPARRSAVRSTSEGRFTRRRPSLASALSQTRRSGKTVTPRAPSGSAKAEKVVKGSGADQVRKYVDAADDDAIITTESIAKTLNIASATVSTALSRMTGKLVERVPGTKRGKFRKINRAA